MIVRSFNAAHLTRRLPAATKRPPNEIAQGRYPSWTYEHFENRYVRRAINVSVQRDEVRTIEIIKIVTLKV